MRRIALTALDKIADGLFLQPLHRQLLAWAADLHECGLEAYPEFLVAE